MIKMLRSSAKTNPSSLAGAMAGQLRQHGQSVVSCVGAGAVNQAIKAVAICRGFVAPSGVDLICIPAFSDIEIDGEDRSAVKLIIEPR
jgi:stage V sporulation protein S